MSDGTLETFRKSAKRLKKAQSLGDVEAVARLAAHVPHSKSLKHADFLHVIAREAGHESWPKLKFALEVASMDRRQRAERLKTALYFGQHWVTGRLLADDPDLKDENLGLQIALLDLPAVRAAVEADPLAATRNVGVRAPLLHLAFSGEIHRSPEKAGAMLAIAELLVAHGADINAGYATEPGGSHTLSALYGALCHADNFELGSWLLEKGADPDDNESLYHSTELGNTKALKLLLQHGAKPRGTNALARALDFHSEEMVRLLLEAGAEPDGPVGTQPGGQPVHTVPALHQAARRMSPAGLTELLLDHGAQPNRVWNGHTPYATARIYGNDAMAELLSRRGVDTSLSETESLLSACARGEVPVSPLDSARLHREDGRLLTRIAFQEDRLPHMRALVSAGLDPDQVDEMKLSPLHAACWAGLPQAVAFLLTLQPDLDRKNAYGGNAFGTVLHGSEHNPDRELRDHVSCARLLLEAGCSFQPEDIAGCGNEEMVQFLEDWQEKSGHE